MKYTVKSRYGDSRYFTIHDDYVLYSFKDSGFTRYGFTTADEYDKNNFTMVDPEGGPYVGTGCLLSDYHPDLPKKEIRTITKIDSGEFKLEF